MIKITTLLQDYDRKKHARRIEIAIGSKSLDMSKFSFMYDPDWDEPSKEMPSKISSLLLDSYYHLPERPDLAFLCLWMAFNSAFYQVAIKRSYETGKSKISDDYGIDCATEAIIGAKNIAVGVNGSIRAIGDFLDIAMQVIPEKLTSMIATNAVRSVCFDRYECGGRYQSMAFNGLKNKFSILGQAIINCHGSAFSEVNHPAISLKNREIFLHSDDAEKNRNIVRSLSRCFQDIFAFGFTSMSDHKNKQPLTIWISQDEKISLLLRYVLYASRNNLSHGKVSSRLNSDTTNPQSYKSNVYLYVIGYIFVAIMLENLGYASKLVITQAMKNLNLIISKPLSAY